MLGWYGSEALENALGDASCGCDLLLKAQAEPDESIKEARTLAAQELQKQWQCPCAGFQPPSSPDGLDSVCQEALGCVQRLTGATGFKTCPIACLRPNAASGEAINRISRAKVYRDKGQLQLVEGELVPQVVIDALDAVDRSIEARTRLEMEQNRKKAKERQANPDVDGPHYHIERGGDDPNFQ